MEKTWRKKKEEKMSNWLTKMLLEKLFKPEVVKDFVGGIIERLFSEENKTELVKRINDAVDIPLVNETDEGKAIKALVDLVETFIREVLEPKEEE